MGKFARTWEMMRESWQVLREDKKILIFPLLSIICSLIVIASFAYPIFKPVGWHIDENWASQLKQNPMYYYMLLLFYIINYFIVVFFNSAMIACVFIRMSGGVPTVGDGFKVAFSRIWTIIGWVLVCATVGVILQMIEDKLKWVGRIVTGLLGMAWTIVSFLVVPMLVIEGVGPITALKESTVLLKKTWGEQLIGTFGFGLVSFVFMLPIMVLMFFGVMTRIFELTVIALIFMVVLMLIQSALSTIYRTAVYLYARDGSAPNGFDEGLLSSAIRPKGSR